MIFLTNIDAERAVLGTLLQYPEQLPEAVKQLNADDFSTFELQEVYKVIVELFNEEKPINPITVTEEIKKKDVNIGALNIARLLQEALPAIQLPGLVEIVRKYSTKRKLLQIAQEVKLMVEKAEEEPEDIINAVQSKLIALSAGKAEIISNKELMLRELDIIEARYKGEIQPGITSGFSDLDALTGGWRPGQLIFLGAVPKMGKTAMALHFALHSKVPTLFFTLEMQPEELADRQISAMGKIEGKKIRDGKLETDDEWKKVTDTADKLMKLPIGWVSKNNINVEEIKAYALQYKREYGLGLIIIDQLDKIYEKPRAGENKTELIGRITRKLKILARELEVPVICLIQLLDKDVSKRANPRPGHGDVRDSSYPDQDADIMLYLWRPYFYWQKPDLKHLAEIIVSRNRAGETGSVWVYWEPEFTRFGLLAREYWPDLEEVMRSVKGA